MADQPFVTLNNGVRIPQLGFGVFKVPAAGAADVVAGALATGYRHIDTAAMYGNEEGVGRAIAEAGLPREQIFVVDGDSKVSKVIEAAAKDAGAPVKVAGFLRFGLGEGVEREEKDFAAEVAGQLAR